jgi:polysaccharide deacetylase family protein (PEP-CTERM system associated)
MKPEISNAMTIDVEDYFQVSAFEPYINKSKWDSIEHRVERNTQKILEMLAERNVKATFFTLAWVAQRYPQLIRAIVEQKHELACHGFDHTRVIEQTPEQFRQDIRLSKNILQDIGGAEVIGYRAASYSINVQNLWAHDIMAEEGFLYSSSIYPVKHDLYGIPDASRFSYAPLPDNQRFLEVPISTIRLGNKNLPCGGGGFFRLYPYAFSKWAYTQINHEGQSGIFYFHPWEIDPKQPVQQNLKFKTKFRHYLNLHRMEDRLTRLLTDFRWNTMQSVFFNKLSESK